MTHITIIGGGISGLATAFYLQQKRAAENLPLHYTVLEQDSRFGGKIVTDTAGSFIIEGGPDSFITQKPWGMQLCRDLGLTERLIPTNDAQRNFFVLKNGQLIPFPGGFRLAVPTEFIPFALSSLISPLGKLRMALDLVIPPRQETDDESLAAFLRRRLGQEAVDMIGEPLMASIYTADPERLSIQSTFPMFVQMERKYGSLIRAMRAAKKKRPPPDPNNPKPAMFTSLRGGMAELVTTLIEQLEDDLCLNTTVQQLRRTAHGFEVLFADNRPPLQTNAVVLAVPAYGAATLVEPFDAALACQLRQIRYVSTGTISLGYKETDLAAPQRAFNGFGFVIPEREQRYIQACTWSSTKFDHRAGPHEVLLRLFIGGQGHEEVVELPDEDLITLARSELLTTMGLTAPPRVQRIFRWRQAAPQYDVGHLERVAHMERLAAQNGSLYLTGSAFRGVGIPDCIKAALTTVEQFTSDIKHEAD